MKVVTLVVGQLNTNCYLLQSKSSLGIIDPGDDAQYIIDKIQALNLTPEWIVLTHGHFDHILAASEIALTFKIPYYLHKADHFLLSRAVESAEHFTGVKPDPILIQPKEVKEDTVLALGKEKIKVMFTPGHTPGSISLYLENEAILICGDLLFDRGGFGRTDFQYASLDDLVESATKVLSLPPEVKLLPGHGSATTLKKWRKETRLFRY